MSSVVEARVASQKVIRDQWLRLLLLMLILAAFARTTLTLGDESLWWDESLTLQRAESSLPPLLKNTIVLSDGRTQVPTTDQHPFFYFLLDAILLRMAGNDEFVLRFVSAAATTSMVAAVTVFARLYSRRRVLPGSTWLWAASLAAVSPFLLWFGQEARPYSLWALLAILSTYTLLRATERHDPNTTIRRKPWLWIVAYIITGLAFLATHYYAVLLLPVHAVLIFRSLYRDRPRFAVALSAGLLIAGAIFIAAAFWLIIVQQQAGANFSHVPLEVLLRDVLNAYSMGLSVDVQRVIYVDVLFGLVGLAGAIYAVRNRDARQAEGWVPVAMVIVPVVGIAIADQFHPVYMTARHLSLIVGPWIVLVGAGLGVAWQKQRWLGMVLTVALIGANVYSTVNYFRLEEYRNDDYARLGAEMDNRIAAGDLVLINSPFAWRVFAYYLPAATMDGMPGDNPEVRVVGVPLLHAPLQETIENLDELSSEYNRIWMLVSGTHPFLDREGVVASWLEDNLFLVQENSYYAHSDLNANQYLAEVPVYESVPDTMQHPTELVFGDTIRVHGYNVAEPPQTRVALPYTLYWEAEQKTDRRYKYILQLVQTHEDGSEEVIVMTEREPYTGATPTTYWDPGKIIVEYGEFPPTDWRSIRSDLVEHPERYHLALNVYDAETLEKLAVTQSGDVQVTDDSTTALFPYDPQ